MAKHFSKDFKTIEERIEILKHRKLLFHDEESAKKILLEKNYFDIVNGFETLLLDPVMSDKEYLPESYFEYFHVLYNFDKNLNVEVLKLIDSFENRLKSSVSYRFCEEVFGRDPQAPPDSYLNPMMYENPYSIYHRINSFPSNTWSTASIKKINTSIDKQINREIQSISRKIMALPTIIQYSKQNNKMADSISECNKLMFETNREINNVNPLIGNIAPCSNGTSVTLLIPFSNMILNPNFQKVSPTTQASIEQIQKYIDDFIIEMKEINMRISKVYSNLAQNNNPIINNMPDDDLSSFMFHNFFKTNHKSTQKINPTTLRPIELDYVEFSKERYGYLRTYDIPPLWVIIKILDLGSLRKLLPGLKSHVLDRVITDMGLPVQEKVLFLNSVKIIQDLRNNCAHFNLVTRFRTNRLTNIDTNLKSKLNLTTKNDPSHVNSHYEIRLFDTLKVLSQFENFDEIHALFYNFFTETDLNEVIKDKFLDRMGNLNRIEWLEI